MPIILVRLTRVSYGNTETCLLAAQKSAKKWRGGRRSAPNASKQRNWGRWGWGIRCRSQSAAHPRIPISHPLCRPPFIRPCARIAVGAAQLLRIFLALSSLRLSLPLRSPTPFALPSQIHNVFFNQIKVAGRNRKAVADAQQVVATDEQRILKTNTDTQCRSQAVYTILFRCFMNISECHQPLSSPGVSVSPHRMCVLYR